MSVPPLVLPNGSVLTVGSFDGVHLGHQALLGEVTRRAAQTGAAPVVVTFEPHPAAVLTPERAPERLTPDVERREFLAQLGATRLVVLRFDAATAALSAERFVRDVLLARYGMRQLVIGANHRFGHRGEGDEATLTRLGRRLGFAVAVLGDVADERGEAISSTRIRAALAQGDLGQAARWLGRPYSLSGRVVRGAGRGATIGMPTINLEGPPPGKALPPDGVYAARVEWGEGIAGAMLNQGARPTVGDTRRSIEAHLFGVDQELYGRMVRVEWVARLRNTERFASLDALRAQLHVDRERALAVLRDPNTSTARPIGAR